MDMFSDDPKPSSLMSALRTCLLLGGIFLLLCAVALPLLELHAGDMRRGVDASQVSEAALEQLQAIRSRCAFSAEKAAGRLAGATREQARKILLDYAENYPEANFTLYGTRTEPLISVGPSKNGRTVAENTSAPAEDTAKHILKVAGTPGYTGYTAIDGVLSLCAAEPVQGGVGRVLVVSLPLDTKISATLEAGLGAEVGILPLMPAAGAKPLGSLASTLEAAARGTPELFQNTTARVMELDRGDVRFTMVMHPLKDSLGEAEALLFVAPAQASQAAADWWNNPFFPYAFALLGFFSLFLWHRAKAQVFAETIHGNLKDVLEAELSSLPEPSKNLPTTLRTTLSIVADALATRKDLARRAVQRLTETDRSSEAECNVSLYKERWTTTRHYDNALNGIYQFGPAGEILRINLSFAVMLGYESALHLQSEHRAIAELFGDPEEARQMLYTLREEPHRRLAVNLRLRNGKTHPFWIMSLPQNGDESEPVEGFLIDREQDVLLEKARRERDQAMERGSSLAMLLAATCLQTQAYFAPRPLEGETCAPEPAVPGRERRRSINSLKDIFDDIYRIGMSASEDAALVMVPIDVYHLMDRVYRQALPAMGAKNIDLTLDVEPDMDVRVSGSEALLCHTLLRCLFMISAPVSGGSAILGVSRDPYTTPPPGKVRFIFSASWLPNMDVPADAPFGAGECLEPNPMADNAMTAPAMSPLELKDEWAVIDYLVRRMNGDPLGTAVTHNARAVQFMVQLDTSELEQQTTGAKAETSEFSFAEAAATAAVESEAFDSQLSAGTLDILVSDQMSDDTETETAGPGLNILLVDDSPNTRMLFSLYLKDTRHRITEAYNGQEGVEAFGAKTFDVVFMDLEMPLMDGYQATRIIRAMEADSGSRPTPIVAVTGYTLPEARQECMLSGCTEFLAKPFSKNALLSMLEALELMRRREA